MSTWVRTSQSPEALSRDAVEAVAAAQGPPGQVATLILPADVSWGEGAQPSPLPPPAAPPVAAADTVSAVAKALAGGQRTAILLGGRGLREDALLAAARISAATGTKLLAEVFPTRLQRGAGRPEVERLAYIPELASVQLQGLKHLVLVDAKAPVTFFAYPGKKSYLVPDGCEVHELAAPDADVLRSLEALVDALGADGAQPALRTAGQARAADRRAHRGDGVPGDRRAAAGGGDRFR